jgi:hypothetical protein
VSVAQAVANPYRKLLTTMVTESASSRRSAHIAWTLAALLTNCLVRGEKPAYLGPESEREKASLHLNCGQRDGHIFARVLDLGEGP